MAFIQPSTHNTATGTFGDEYLMYITLAMHQESDTGPKCILGRAGHPAHKRIGSNERPYPDNHPPICKIIFVNVGILRIIRFMLVIQVFFPNLEGQIH